MWVRITSIKEFIYKTKSMKIWASLPCYILRVFIEWGRTINPVATLSHQQFQVKLSEATSKSTTAKLTLSGFVNTSTCNGSGREEAGKICNEVGGVFHVTHEYICMSPCTLVFQIPPWEGASGMFLGSKYLQPQGVWKPRNGYPKRW